MESKRKAAGVMVALAAILIGASSVPAQPGDPPGGKIEIELGFSPRGITFRVGVQPKLEGTPSIDAFTPVFLDHCLSHLGDMLARPDRFISVDAILNKLPNLRQQETSQAPAAKLEKLFNTAEFYRRTGAYGTARRLYQQIHVLAPTSPIGQLAIQRIGEVEERLRDVSEEEQQIPDGPDDPEQAFRDMHMRTVPLGLVDVSY